MMYIKWVFDFFNAFQDAHIKTRDFFCHYYIPTKNKINCAFGLPQKCTKMITQPHMNSYLEFIYIYSFSRCRYINWICTAEKYCLD